MLVPILISVGSMLLVGGALLLAVQEINGYLARKEKALAKKRIRELRERNNGDLRSIYKAHYDDMSRATRRLFRRYM